MPYIAGLLKVPARIHQEDGTRDIFERVFQGIDKDEDGDIELEEFLSNFIDSSSHYAFGEAGPPPSSTKPKSDEKPTVKKDEKEKVVDKEVITSPPAPVPSL